ncbi:MAG: hypothetical protein J5I98_17635 [Phaeodactylibacter sp.]|nr:hypothetical protein [Phaeodactylibacter sp.]
MPLSDKAAANILRLLDTREERNSLLAYRLLNSQGVADDFLLSLCGYFMVAEGEQRLVLRRCLNSLLRMVAREKSCTPGQNSGLMWLLNYDPSQEKANTERILLLLEDALGLDILALSRFLFSRSGQCASFLLRRGTAADKKALLAARSYDGPQGRTLDLSRMGLAQMPEETRQCADIEALDLSHNELDISDVFFLQRFRKLRFLSLARNRMDRIPDGLLLLPGLQEADLRMNTLRMPLFDYLRHPLREIVKVNLRMERGFALDQFSVQDVACVLKNWAYEADNRLALKLSGRGFRSVPDALRSFPQLVYIDLRNNPISFLPPWFLRMPALREVYCDRGVEYNPSYLRPGLAVYRENEQEPPAPKKQEAPWLANLAAFPAELPVAIPVEGLRRG